MVNGNIKIIFGMCSVLSNRFILVVHTHRVDVCFLALHNVPSYLNMRTRNIIYNRC